MMAHDAKLQEFHARLLASRAEVAQAIATIDGPADPLWDVLVKVQARFQALEAVTQATVTQTNPGARPVIFDVPGKPLVLAVVGADGKLQGVELEPLDALALAVDLTTSARRRLAGGEL
ncbi:hypothetical protein GAY28_15850 [Azospirillum brasilense]|nr:hypothetical protein [Azospirillum brasilense]